MVLLLCCCRASTPLACSHDSGFYSLYQYCYCQYWKCTSIAAQIIPLPNSRLVCSFSCWDFLLIPSGLQNHFGSSHLAHYIMVVTFFAATAQNRKIVYDISTGSPAFSVYIYMTPSSNILKHRLCLKPVYQINEIVTVSVVFHLYYISVLE